MKKKIDGYDINASNIDDYIREQKKKGVKRIYWNKKEFELLKTFIIYNGFCSKSYYRYILNNRKWWQFWKPQIIRIKVPLIKSGIVFMGIKHYLRIR